MEPECEIIYQEMIIEQKRLYNQRFVKINSHESRPDPSLFLFLYVIYSWNKVLAPIWNSEDVPASVLLSGRLREKDKTLIKEKFSVILTQS